MLSDMTIEQLRLYHNEYVRRMNTDRVESNRFYYKRSKGVVGAKKALSPVYG